MCDETTVLTRREFAAMGAAILAAGAWSEADALEAGLSEAMVEVKTADGTCEAFFVHPSRGKHPAVIFWPDAIALRDTKKAMARRLAAEGYAVLAVNQYYRTNKLPIGIGFGDFADEEKRKSVMGLFQSVTPDNVMRDAAAFAVWLDRQDAVDTSRGIGTQGYCMGGAMTIRTAAAVPGRVKAAASFHGGQLATDAPDSPHRLLARTTASFLILPGADDAVNEPHAVAALREAADAAGRPAEIEVFNANHGWCVPDAPSYDEAEADRAFAKLLTLYAKL
jgi:carboxymethylenebutenolidase